MNIAIDGHMIGDRSGGNESYYKNVLRFITPSPQDNLYLFLRNGVDGSEYSKNFHVVYYQSKDALMRNFYELDKLCRKYKIDVLHAQYFIPFIRSCKVVCTIFDICFEHYSNIFTRREYIRQKLLIRYAAKHADKIITCSRYSKHDIVRQYKVNPENVIVAYCAVNNHFKKLSPKELDELELRNKFHIGKEKYILSVGNLQPRKNLPNLIKAYSKWKENSKSDAKLVIVGKKAWMFNDVLQVAGFDPDNIILTDYVSETDLVRLYNAATCFIYPSFFEGFGIPPLESMTCGTPVAVANKTSLPEVVGNAGLYFDPYNVTEIEGAINKLMQDEDLRLSLINKGYVQKEKFSWEKSADIIYRTYNIV